VRSGSARRTLLPLPLTRAKTHPVTTTVPSPRLVSSIHSTSPAAAISVMMTRSTAGVAVAVTVEIAVSVGGAVAVAVAVSVGGAVATGVAVSVASAVAIGVAVGVDVSVAIIAVGVDVPVAVIVTAAVTVSLVADGTIIVGATPPFHTDRDDGPICQYGLPSGWRAVV